jgi:hypothetical protein
MIRRRRQSSATKVEVDVRARFVDALKRVPAREVEVTADVRRALARAARRKAKGTSGWLKTRGADIRLFSSRPRFASA